MKEITKEWIYDIQLYPYSTFCSGAGKFVCVFFSPTGCTSIGKVSCSVTEGILLTITLTDRLVSALLF